MPSTFAKKLEEKLKRLGLKVEIEKVLCQTLNIGRVARRMSTEPNRREEPIYKKDPQTGKLLKTGTLYKLEFVDHVKVKDKVTASDKK